jgi:hypothetical protein
MTTSLSLADCEIWPFAKDKDGYGLCKNAKGKTARAHREAYKAAYGEIPNGKMILHLCNNPSCVNVAHLYAGDGYDNMRDRKAAGRNTGWKGANHIGENNTRAILTEKDVRDIRHNRRYGMSRILAEKYSTTPAYIRRIWARDVWQHLS